MTAPLFYVYSPNSGKITARPTGYCNGGSHPGACLQLPFDINAAYNAQIICKASSYIQSIKITNLGYGPCLRSEIPAPWDVNIRVNLYKSLNGQGLVGSVCYSHVKNPTANGIYNTRSKCVGYIPQYCGCGCNKDQKCKCGGYNELPGEKGYCAKKTGLCSEKCPCVCCYGGLHVHISANADTYNTGLTCDSSVTRSTWVYAFYTV